MYIARVKYSFRLFFLWDNERGMPGKPEAVWEVEDEELLRRSGG